MIQLVLPHTKYKQTYLEAAREFQEENNPRASNYLSLNLDELIENFEAYVQKLHDQVRGIGLPEGFVPATEFWIIGDEQTYLGRVHIRHELNDYLLQFGGHIGYNIRSSARGKGFGSRALELGLVEAKKLGLSQVLLTCDDDNIPSARIIEKCGGVLQNKVMEGQTLKRRYWISLEKNK